VVCRLSVCNGVDVWFLFRMGRLFCGRHLSGQVSSRWGPSERQRGGCYFSTGKESSSRFCSCSAELLVKLIRSPSHLCLQIGAFGGEAHLEVPFERDIALRGARSERITAVFFFNGIDWLAMRTS